MLNERQQRFVAEYLKSFNATDAVVKAGYSGNHPTRTSSQLMKRPEIKAEIARLNKEINLKPAIASAEEIRAFYSNVMNNKMDEPCTIKDRIMAADSLAKTYALFTDKVQVDGKMGVTIINDIPKSGDGA